MPSQHGPIDNSTKIDPVNPTKVFKVTGSTGKDGDRVEFSYSSCKYIGHGSFGQVLSAELLPDSLPPGTTDKRIAIKKVLQDPRFKNRELQMARIISHPNVINLQYFFYSNGDQKGEVYLNLVLEFLPETLYRSFRRYADLKQIMPIFSIKLYMYQLLRSLAYIHSLGICHRDIKPQNVLVDPSTGALKLIDFGSAKCLVKGQPNVSYICSRYYRAPELIFGATEYTNAIDIWSTACCMGELMLGRVLFDGESGVDQLVEIIKVLGTPSREQIITMNPHYMDHKFPQIKAQPWPRVFRPRTNPEAIDLISKLLQYPPGARPTSVEGMCHPFFDELKGEGVRMPSGRELPALFNFTDQELSIQPELISRLVPKHAEAELLSRGVDVNAFVPIPLDRLRISLD